MYVIKVPKIEMYNELANEFQYFDGGELQLEHSLISVRKWEAKWHIPFLEEKQKTIEQIKDYIRCMTLNKVKDPWIYDLLSQQHLEGVLKYIEDPSTASWVREDNGLPGLQTSKREKVTAELIYFWMISLQIPTEFEKWHLNQLMMLIKVVNAKNKTPKKRSAKDLAAERARINAERRAKTKSKG